jgi:succinoglycan biosynthesis transport protein ExoP
MDAPMLQIDKSPMKQVSEGDAYEASPLTGASTPADLFAVSIKFIRRQLSLILFVALLTIGLAVTYLVITPPFYSAYARILINTGKVQLLQRSVFVEEPLNITGVLDSQIEILQSDNFALSVIKKLRLIEDPEFTEPDGLIGVVHKIKSVLFGSKREELSESELAQRAVAAFDRKLKVSRVGYSYAIEIAFQSRDPDRAAQIANAVADGFIVDQLDAKYQALREATTWLQGRLDELRGQALAAERAVVEYKTKNNIVSAGDGRLINEQELAQLNTALVQAHAAKAEAQARLDRIRQILRENENPDQAKAVVATVSESLQNPVITQLRQQYLDLAQREALYTNRYGSNHLAVVNLRNRMQEIRRSIVDELNQIAGAYKSDYDIAEAREKSLEQNLNATVTGSQMTNKAQIELRQLESAAQNYRALYDTLQQRYMDSVQQQSLPTTEARVITQAAPPSQQSSPKSLLILAGASMGGLLLGLGLATLRELADRTLKTGKQVEADLAAQCVAVIPMIKPGVQIASVNKAAADPSRSRIISPKTGLLRHVVDSPLSPFAESIRALKISADLSGSVGFNKVIGVTSSVPNEGKSTIAASLAQMCAHSGARVILVDCDLRRPSLSQELAPNETTGLIDVISDAASLDKVVWVDPVTHLHFLPAGVRSRMIHTSEVLFSPSMKRFFGRLRDSYDYVIVDLSPVNPVVDVRTAIHLLDSYVFVAEWGKTKIDVARHALNTARGIYDNLLGVVLNKVNFKRLNRYDGDGHYYDRGYYAHYNYTE